MAAPPLVSTSWLADALAKNAGSDALRVVDATVWLGPTKSGRPDFEAAHIADKEAVFADLVVALSDKNSKLFCTNPGPEQFKEAIEALGIGDSTRVIIYDRFDRMWSTRLKWMLESYGFRNASVLDGGFDKWKAEGRPVFAGPGNPFPPGRVSFTPRLDRTYWATKDEVLQAVQSGTTCIINALSPENHSGKDASYKRAGRIPGARNVFFKSILNKDGTYLPVEELKKKFDFVQDDKRHITYCGGGIAATSDAFVLRFLLQHKNIGVFDGSLIEWTADPANPMEVDEQGKL